jgi:hypothetical protein
VIPVAQRIRLIGEPESRISLEEVPMLSWEKAGQDSSKLAQWFDNQIKRNRQVDSIYDGTRTRPPTIEQC